MTMQRDNDLSWAEQAEATIERLQDENAALWAFVRAQRAVDRGISDFTLRGQQVAALRHASAVVRIYDRGEANQ